MKVIHSVKMEYLGSFRKKFFAEHWLKGMLAQLLNTHYVALILRETNAHLA